MENCSTTTSAVRNDISEVLAIFKKLPPLYNAVRKDILASVRPSEPSRSCEMVSAEKELRDAFNILTRAQKRITDSQTN
jgi:hypothetical protein